MKVSRCHEDAVLFVVVCRKVRKSPRCSHWPGVDTVISAVGRDVIAAQIQLIDIAVQSPTVKWFFPSEYGTDVEYGPQSIHEKPHQGKLQVRAHLAATAIRGEDLAYTYVVTGPFAELYVGPGAAAEPRGGSFDVAAKKACLLGDGGGKLSLTTMPEYYSPFHPHPLPGP